MLDAYEHTLADAANACADMVAGMETGTAGRWLTLAGVNGCGKSHLARQVWREAVRINPGNPSNNPIWPPDWYENAVVNTGVYRERRPYAIWLDEPKFVGNLRAGDFDLPTELGRDFFVGFDDLGISRDPTRFAADKLADLAERRLGKWTVWTTNLTMAEIAERIDARVASRMVRDENRVVRIAARDYALAGRKRNP